MKRRVFRNMQRNIARKYILSSNDDEIMEITQNITQRYRKKYPDWDVTLLSLPKDPVQREEALMRMIEFYRNHPEM